MAYISAKDLFRQARELEKAGDIKKAASGYAKLAKHLNRKEKYKEAKKIVSRALELAPDLAP